MNDLDLPPQRTLPPDVRDRLRARLDTPFDAPRRARFRGPLTAAAGVAVLVAGALIISQAVRGTPDELQPGNVQPASTTAAPSDPTAVRALMETVLDRCVAAVAGRGYPRRDQWEPVVYTGAGDLFVVAARAGGKPFVCQATSTSVTVSNPGGKLPQSAGTTAGLLLNTPEGVVAGVADPAWQHVGVLAMDPANTLLSTVAQSKDG